MLQALLAGVASIKAQQSRMNVIGNNLANVNTTAYKTDDLSFDSIISQTLSSGTAPSATMGGTNPIQYGLGVTVGATSTNTGQGSLNATNVPSDLAIQGNGYFAVSDGKKISYTRDGGFDVDANGYLVQRSTGQRLLGWSADSTGKIDTTQQLAPGSSLQIPLGTAVSSEPTANLALAGNLNAAASNTDSWSTQMSVYDSLGAANTLTIVFNNHQVPPPAGSPPGATSSWDWTAYEGSASGPVVGSSSTAGNSPLYFDATGKSVAGLPAGTYNQIIVPGNNGSNATQINLKIDGISQLDATSSVALSTQDGVAPGTLESYSIGQDGIITGSFANGLTKPLGEIAVNTFANPAGLLSTGQNLYATSVNSGNAVSSPSGTAAAGTISAGFLEQSNVDIGTEFTNLIITQRGFQANTKIVTTVDQMLQDLVNMKQ